MPKGGVRNATQQLRWGYPIVAIAGAVSGLMFGNGLGWMLFGALLGLILWLSVDKFASS